MFTNQEELRPRLAEGGESQQGQQEDTPASAKLVVIELEYAEHGRSPAFAYQEKRQRVRLTAASACHIM